MKLRSVRMRLLLAYAGLILFGFTGLALLAGRQIAQGATEDFQQNLEAEAALIARSLRDRIEEVADGDESVAVLETAVAGFAAQQERRITLLDAAGRAWLDSGGSPSAASERAQPEVAAALTGRTAHDVRTDAQGTQTVYAAAPILEDGRVLSIVRISAPLKTTQAQVAQRWLGLAVGVGGLTLLALLASLWLAASLTRPLRQLRHSALQLAGGNLAHRADVTRGDEFGELGQTFNHMAAQLQALLEEQRAFASNASHELRTPLTTIRLRSEALREGGLDEATARQYVAEIDDEVTRLGYLVNDLILLSRLDAGRAELGTEPVDAARVARGLLRGFEAQTAAKGLAVSLEAPADLPSVAANPGHLQVVMQNLLDNAVKYAAENGRVHWQFSAAGGMLQMTLINSGPGIAPEDLPHVFERFYRADKARTRAVAGTGLGLALTRSIVRLYHGQIAIDSPPGEGTRVQLWWPLQQ